MREQWKTRSGFIYAAVGAAVGLGNLWRFPFQAYKNGGGAFFLPYIVALFTCAIPLMIMEYAYGRKIRGGATKAFAAFGKKYELFGWVQVMIPVVVMMFYCTIVSISVIFMGYSIAHAFGFVSFLNNPGGILGMVTGKADNAFDIKSGISLPMLGTVILVWLSNWAIVRKGIVGGIEKISKFITPLLMLLMILFMINSVRLDGAFLGLNELFTPNFEKIMDANIWVSAYAQVFFSSTLAVGVMIAYGSYLQDDSDIVNNAFITVLANASFDIIAGITVFATLGYLVQTQGVAFDSFGFGAGVAFVAFPIAISTMTANVFLQGLIGFVFFFCMFIAGLSSSISMLESFNTAAMDKFNVDRKKLTTILSICGFCGSSLFATYAGFNHILDLVDSYVGNYVIVTSGLFEVVIISYLYGTNVLREEANAFSDFKITKLWDNLLRYFTPVLLGITVIMNLVTGVQKMIGMDKTTLNANIVFGWGAVVTMVIAASLLYRKAWKKEAI